MNEELKPCPFCKNRTNIKLVEYRPNRSGAVICGNCGARGPKAKNDHMRGWKPKAIEGWNTRYERKCKNVFLCRECSEVVFYDDNVTIKHCPNCGAKLVEK